MQQIITFCLPKNKHFPKFEWICGYSLKNYQILCVCAHRHLGRNINVQRSDPSSAVLYPDNVREDGEKMLFLVSNTNVTANILQIVYIEFCSALFYQ